MKEIRIILMVGLFGAFSATVDAQSTNANASATAATKTQLKPVFPVVQYKLEVKKLEAEPGPADKADKIARYGNSSSQAWTTIATRRENPTVFHDAKTHEPRLIVFSLSF